MAAAVLTPNEDQTFAALFDFISKVLGLPYDTDQIVKGFQNLVATPTGSYVVVSPGIMQRQDFGRRGYDPDGNATIVGAHQTYSYQVDCYGPEGPTWASVLHAAWRTMWAVDNMPSGVLMPLHSDAPQQLNVVNSEGQFEQRFMIRLFGQVNQQVTLPQDFFDVATLDSIIVADQL
ncbi:hypothetical protein [Xanthomonas phage NEB7]|nr:hypothetical protein [Xanthomonas phage NEB7]